MNHYINLLEPAEIHYLSSASTNPLYKIGAMVAVGLIVLFFGNQYMKLRSTINEGNQIEEKWQAIEEDVEQAKVLNEKKMRLEQGLKTLKGWSSSRHHWPEILDYIVDQSPVPPEDLQFTRLSFDERMIGLRDQRPGSQKAKIFPLKRSITITLRGIVRSNAPGRILPQYTNTIQSGENQPARISLVNLDSYSALRDEDGERMELTEFTFYIQLEEREVTP